VGTRDFVYNIALPTESVRIILHFFECSSGSYAPLRRGDPRMHRENRNPIEKQKRIEEEKM